MFPSIRESKYFTPAGFESGDFVVAANLSGAPQQFHRRLQSGVRTSNLTTDMSQELVFKTPTAEVLRADSFVVSDLTITYAKGQMAVSY